MQKPTRSIPKRRKKMALYEVFSKGLSNSRRDKQLSTFSNNEPTVYPGQPSYSQQAQPIPTKPKIFQTNRGRLELSLRYELAVVLILALMLCFMVAYRLGEHTAASKNAPEQAITAPNQQDYADNAAVAVQPDIPKAPAVVEKRPTIEGSASSGSNWIVILSHKDKRDLVPVQAYFAGNGIETQIRQVGGLFLLHTTETYDNPMRFGSSGYKARQRVLDIGTGYEPPTGYGKFDFSTAYGMKSIE